MTILAQYDELLCPVYERIKDYLSEFIQKAQSHSYNQDLNQLLQRFDHQGDDKSLLANIPHFLDYLHMQDSNLNQILTEATSTNVMLQSQMQEARAKSSVLSQDNKFLTDKIMVSDHLRKNQAQREGVLLRQKEQEIAQLQRQLTHYDFLHSSLFQSTSYKTTDEDSFCYHPAILMGDLFAIVQQRFLFEGERLRQQISIDQLDQQF